MTVHAYTTKSVVGRSDIRAALKDHILLWASDPLFETLAAHSPRSNPTAILSAGWC